MMLKTEGPWPGSRPNEPAPASDTAIHKGNGALSSMPSANTATTQAAWLADVALDDWDALFCAVKARLTWLASDRPLHTATERDGESAANAAAHLRAGVLECVVALDQLHNTLTHEDSRRGEVSTG